MSILAKKLVDICHTSGPEIGFRRSSGLSKKRQMLVVANVSGQDKSKIKSVATSGIDALLADSKTLNSAIIQDEGTIAGEIPLGIKIDDIGRKEEISLSKNIDYVVVNLDTPVEAVDSEETGKILVVESDLSPNMIRMINNLSISVDGVLLADNEIPITFRRLITCNLFSELLHKPLLISIPAEITGSQLGNLCRAGVKGVIIAPGASAKACSVITKAVDNLPRITKRTTKQDALLPALNHSQADTDEEEEEDI